MWVGGLLSAHPTLLQNANTPSQSLTTSPSLNRHPLPAHTHNQHHSVGDKPPSTDYEGLSWWVGRILLLFAPDNETGLRDALLTTESTLKRLQDEQRLLQGRMEGAGSCAVM